MARTLLDSDVIIWYLRGRADVRRWVAWLSAHERPSCSALSVLEVAAGTRPHEEAVTRAFLESLDVIAPRASLTWRAGIWIRDFQRRGVTLDMVDAVIAATAVEHSLLLATFNTRHYPLSELTFAPAPPP